MSRESVRRVRSGIRAVATSGGPRGSHQIVLRSGPTLVLRLKSYVGFADRILVFLEPPNAEGV
jgi:hypothetical protein